MERQAPWGFAGELPGYLLGFQQPTGGWSAVHQAGDIGGGARLGAGCSGPAECEGQGDV